MEASTTNLTMLEQEAMSEGREEIGISRKISPVSASKNEVWNEGVVKCSFILLTNEENSHKVVIIPRWHNNWIVPVRLQNTTSRQASRKKMEGCLDWSLPEQVWTQAQDGEQALLSHWKVSIELWGKPVNGIAYSIFKQLLLTYG